MQSVHTFAYNDTQSDNQITSRVHQYDGIGRLVVSRYRQYWENDTPPSYDTLLHTYSGAKASQNRGGGGSYGKTWHWAGAAYSNSAPLLAPSPDTASEYTYKYGNKHSNTQRTTISGGTTAGDDKLLYGQGRPMAKDASGSGSSFSIGVESENDTGGGGSVESRFIFEGTVAPTDLDRATDVREKGRIGIFGTSMAYAGSSGRVLNEAIGRDLNPLGRGTGSALMGGSLNLGRIAPMLPKSISNQGNSGNSVNNAGCVGCGGGGASLGTGGGGGSSPANKPSPSSLAFPGEGFSRYHPPHWRLWDENCNYCCNVMNKLMCEAQKDKTGRLEIPLMCKGCPQYCSCDPITGPPLGGVIVGDPGGGTGIPGGGSGGGSGGAADGDGDKEPKPPGRGLEAARRVVDCVRRLRELRRRNPGEFDNDDLLEALDGCCRAIQGLLCDEDICQESIPIECQCVHGVICGNDPYDPHRPLPENVNDCIETFNDAPSLCYQKEKRGNNGREKRPLEDYVDCKFKLIAHAFECVGMYLGSVFGPNPGEDGTVPPVEPLDKAAAQVDVVSFYEEA